MAFVRDSISLYMDSNDGDFLVHHALENNKR